jgi:hypothetical protein
MEFLMTGALTYTNTFDRGVLLLSFLAIFFLSYFLFFQQNKLSVSSLQVVGTIQTDGILQRRQPRSLGWENIQTDSQIYLKDFIYVPKNTKATIVLKNKKTLELESDSMIQFDEIFQDQIQISLLDSVQKAFKGTENTVVMQKQKFEFIPMIQFVQKRLESLEPMIQMQQEMTESLKKHLQVALKKIKPVTTENILAHTLFDYELNLISPVDDRYNSTSNQWIAMLWTDVPLKGVEYELEISKYQDFHKVIKHQTKKNKLKIQLQDPGEYYWKVNARFEKEKLSSNIKKFTMTKRGGKTLLKFNLPKPQFNP